MIVEWFKAMAAFGDFLSKFAFLLPFLGIFLLLWLIFRRTKPGVPPLKRRKFWIFFLSSCFVLFALFILLVLFALREGQKKIERETEKERDTTLNTK
jgi:hypothetical protein